MTMELNEQDGGSLLRPLAGGQPRGASTVDIARAIADGDRHHRRVRLAGSAGAGATVVIVAVAGWTAVADGPQRTAPAATGSAPTTTSAASATKPAVTCVVRQLATPAGEGPKAVVIGADPTGRYIVGRTYPNGHPSTVVWDNLVPRKVPMQGDDPVLNDATSAGVLVGSSYTGSDTTTAWVYKGGKMLRLAGANATASAINEREVIVGSVQGKPVMWASPTAQPTMLAMPAGKGWTGGASGVDDDGTIVGTLQSDGQLEGAAFVWAPDGKVRKLPQPTVKGQPANTSSAHQIRDGWVVGWAAYDEPNRGPRWLGAPRWNLRTGAVDTTEGVFSAINAQGRIVGQLDVVAPDGTRVTLPLPDGLEPKATSVNTETISDNGTIVAGYLYGRAGDISVQPVAVAWRCGT